MVTTVLWLVTLTFTTVIANLRQSEKIRNHGCDRGDKIVNDCNWCYCHNNQFVCQSRDCKSVDVFGHFNDAIQALNVGMEGHGTWRSTDTACEPNVHYRRGAMLCVCGEDGVWPNPACRDTFRVLHPVEILNGQKCTPMKLYLDGCNVCFCPSDGRLSPKLCTKEICRSDDPVMKKSSKLFDVDDSKDLELYATCDINESYLLDDRTCTCLRNNRLLCSNSTRSVDDDGRHCKSVPPNTVFNIDCNLCYCDELQQLICSAKRCLGLVAKITSRRLMDIDERYFVPAERPLDLHTCKIGTKFKKGCNTCICLEHETGPMFACTARRCSPDVSLVRTIKEGCVLHTTYEWNCLKCSCVMANNEKWQWCETNNLCLGSTTASNDLSAQHGYCEPLHDYVSDCNRCHCLSDGKTVVCSDMKCDKSGISVEIIPVLQRGYDCPRGQAYKIDCNICYCLLNGNSLCTTLDCSEKQVN